MVTSTGKSVGWWLQASGRQTSDVPEALRQHPTYNIALLLDVTMQVQRPL